MTWLTPLVGGIAAAVLIPSLIVLYFLKLRRRDVEISTTLLWKKSIQDLQANAPFQKLRRNILLLLQLLILGAGVLALAQPQYMAQRAVGDRHVILIDRSASMSSTDGDPNRPDTKTRLDVAKEDAIQLVESLREPGLFSTESGDQAMVIAFDATAEVRQTFTTDKEALVSAIRAIEPTDSVSSLEQAITLARAHAPPRTIVDEFEDANGEMVRRVVELPAGSVGTIHIYSDGRLRATDKAETHPDDAVLLHPVGDTDAPNIGITTLRAARDFDDPTELTVFVGLSSTDPNPRAVDVELLIDGTPLRIREIPDLPGLVTEETPGEGAEGEPAPPPVTSPGIGGTRFKFQRPTGGVVTVRVDPRGADVLPTDNRAWIVVPPAKQLSVALVDGGSFVVREALTALEPTIGVDVISRDELTSALEERAYDVVVLDGWMPDPPEGSEDPLPPGRWIVLGAAPTGPTGLTAGEKVQTASVLNWSRDHPALRGLSLSNVSFGEVTSYEIGEQSIAEPLATTEAGPAIVEMATARMRALIVPGDVTRSTWWLDPSFVVFLAKSVRYLGEEGTSGVARMVHPGDVIADRLPQGAQDVTIELPGGGRSRLVPSEDGRIVYGPVSQSGIYVIRWAGEPGATDMYVDGRAVRPFTANLLDAAESDVRTATALSLPSQIVTGEAGGTTARTIRLWPWLLMAGLGIMMLEWFIYNRKVHV